MRLIRNHRNEKQSKPFSYVQQTVKAAVVAVPALDWQCRSKVFSCLTSPAKYKEHSFLLFHNNSDLRADNVSYRKELCCRLRRGKPPSIAATPLRMKPAGA